MLLQGNAIKYGDNVDTDVIIPARYLNTADEVELASHCMADIDPDFQSRRKPGDIMVAGQNFGCGSSREHAPLAIKAAGISCIIAQTFARIFFRNAINIGLPILTCPQAAAEIAEGDQIRVDLQTGVITNLTKQRSYQSSSYPAFMQQIIRSGGLIAYTRETVQRDGDRDEA